MNDYKLDLEKYATLARQAAAEGCVLLENEKQALPLREGESVAVFGRMAFHYYKSGLGSGGLVNTRYVVGILDALKECKEIQLDEKLLGIYANWIKENPYDEGQGWGRVPWSQKEMEVTEEMLDCARSNDVSLIIIGRTAGEDQDNNTNPGSYCLTETEEDLICRVCEVSKCTVVVLNVGNIIDMSWVEKYHPQAVLYAWQGGQEGGTGHRFLAPCSQHGQRGGQHGAAHTKPQGIDLRGPCNLLHHPNGLNHSALNVIVPRKVGARGIGIAPADDKSAVALANCIPNQRIFRLQIQYIKLVNARRY